MIPGYAAAAGNPASAPLADQSRSTWLPAAAIDGPLSYPSSSSSADHSPATNSLPVASGSGSQPSPLNPAAKKSDAKKKRKKAEDENGSTPDEKEKRIKTGRACDACRTKKIRCDILPAPDLKPGEVEPQPLCAHCRQAGLECSFYLPITETRFKNKKAAEDSGDTLPLSMTRDRSLTPPNESSGKGRIEGPTSIPFLLHTSLPSRSFQQYDLHNHTQWEVTDDGHGVIHVNAPPDAMSSHRSEKPILSEEVITALVNAYFDHLAHLFPIVLRTDFVAKSTPNPLLLYAICGVAATRREFPREIFAAVRGAINGLLKSNDILSDARLEHVQALLLISQVGDLHAQPTASTASASLIRTGTAIRMAQDLGLHRETNTRGHSVEDLVYMELRRRVWACCVVLDRWYGAALGVPMMIDLHDCDVLLPAAYDVLPDVEPALWPRNPSFVALTEHLKLAVIVGRVIKTVYGPTGLEHTTDQQLNDILDEMTSWMAGLPQEVRFQDRTSSHASGLMHLAHAALQFLLWRVFMRITHICPPHLKFTLDLKRWTQLVDWSREAIDWLHNNDEVLDTLFIFPYTATSCALVQYHTWARRRDPAALECLRTVKDTVLRWEQLVKPDQMSIRRKTCETMTLLYEAALKTNHESDGSADRPDAAPTPGVKIRPSIGKTLFIKDDSLPGGGVFVAQSEEEAIASGLPRSNVVVSNSPNIDPTGFSNTMTDLQVNTTNLNPQIEQGPPMDQQNLQPEFAANQELPFMVPDANALDVSLLDIIPDANFDWNTWSHFFDTMNRVHSATS